MSETDSIQIHEIHYLTIFIKVYNISKNYQNLGFKNFFFCTYLIADERHPAVVRPREADDGRVAVVDELDGPTALVLEPQFIRLFESLVLYVIDLVD